MKVRYAVNLEEHDLRSIRAAIGCGGKATRKECVTFIDRAVRKAIKDAPDPKPARTRQPKPAPAVKTVETPEQEHERLSAERDSIARKFGHQTTGMQHRLPTEKEMARYRKAKENMGVSRA